MKRFFKKLFKRGDFMTRADKAYYGHKFKTVFWSVFSLFIISWVGTNLVLCALTTNVTSNWDLSYEARKEIVLPTLSAMKYNNLHSFIFDYYTAPNEYVVDGTNVLSNCLKETLISNEDGSVEQYTDSVGKNIYILSELSMVANPNQTSLIQDVEILKLKNFNTKLVKSFYFFFGKDGVDSDDRVTYKLRTIEGLENLDTSSATSIY